MTYAELLTQKEWYNKCNDILLRDKLTCQVCGSIGFHKNTIYVTESLDEVDKIINEKVLLGVKYSTLIAQTFEGYNEYDEGDDSGLYIDSDGKIIWEQYQNVNIIKQCPYDDYFVNKIRLYKKDGNFFRFRTESICPIFITHTPIVPLEFKVHRYNTFIHFDDGTRMSCPMAILVFDEELTNKYYLSIEDDMICVTYKNYVFFVFQSRYSYKYRGLNIHHKYYVFGKKPWEYENDALVTLCGDCHKKQHEKPIPMYRSLLKKDVLRYCEKCDRCGGTGYLPQYDYYQDGVCFKCGGEGTVVV